MGGERERGEKEEGKEGREREGTPKGWLTPRLRNPEKYPDARA